MTQYASHHADDQMLARYGFGPSTAQWRKAFLDIVEGRSLLAQRSETREIHYVLMGSRAVRVVYAPHLALVITALPLCPKKRRNVTRLPRYRELDLDTDSLYHTLVDGGRNERYPTTDQPIAEAGGNADARAGDASGGGCRRASGECRASGAGNGRRAGA